MYLLYLGMLSYVYIGNIYSINDVISTLTFIYNLKVKNTIDIKYLTAYIYQVIYICILCIVFNI